MEGMKTAQRAAQSIVTPRERCHETIPEPIAMRTILPACGRSGGFGWIRL